MKEVKNDVKEWSNGLAKEVRDEGVQKFVTGADNCLNVGDDGVGE